MSYLSKLLSAVSLSLLFSVSAQADTITPKEAGYYVGSSVTVAGVVSQVSTSRGTTFINFGGRFPNHVFYAVIFKSDSGRFSDVRGLEGNTVGITGTVEFYRSKPQIILHSPDQIELRN